LADFYACVVHELRTPLFSIRGALDLLASEGMDDREAKELVAISDSEVQRMLRLVNDLLDLKKIESDELTLNLTLAKPGDIVDRAVDALFGMAKEAQVELVAHVDTETIVNCDQDRIIQVLANLLANAIRFSKVHEKVCIKVTEKQGRVRFAITDCGAGIPSEKQSMLFQKFKRLADHYQGSGLGLTIAKSIVERHGGEIGVESQVGKGSTFWFEVNQFEGAGLKDGHKEDSSGR
jgi:signal transduction histidine kinase